MRFQRRLVMVGVLMVAATVCGYAQSGNTGDGGSRAEAWFAQVSKTQAEQPHWITPLATTTPRLEEEFRYDIFWQPKADGTITENYGGGKGLELIPFERVEIIISPPSYAEHNTPGVEDGFTDLSFLVKYRLAASNEEHHNYILTAFLGMSLPTASTPNGAKHPVLTPTLAYGKGFGRFDLQGTFGVSLPTAEVQTLGRTYAWNNAFQCRIFRRLWPEVEVNSTFFQDGKNAGRSQVYLTPGLVIGKIPLWKRLGLTLGAGIQIATTHFNTSNHNLILSARLPF